MEFYLDIVDWGIVSRTPTSVEPGTVNVITFSKSFFCCQCLFSSQRHRKFISLSLREAYFKIPFRHYEELIALYVPSVAKRVTITVAGKGEEDLPWSGQSLSLPDTSLPSEESLRLPAACTKLPTIFPLTGRSCCECVEVDSEDNLDLLNFKRIDLSGYDLKNSSITLYCSRKIKLLDIVFEYVKFLQRYGGSEA